jgi:hypothetical protein
MSKRNRFAKAKPWERLTGESEEAYASFTAYRDLGLQRTFEGVAAGCMPGGGKSVSLLRRWGQKWDWVERCRHWDNHLQSQRDSLLMADARKWEQRRLAELESAWNDVQALRVRARKMLAFPLSTQTVESKDGKTITTVKPARWTMGHAAMMLKLAAEIGAAIAAATAKDPADMTDAELIGIEEAMGDALGVLDESAA